MGLKQGRGRPPIPKTIIANPPIALQEPDGQATALDMLSEPFSRFMQLGEELGLSKDVLRRVVQRIKARYQPVLSELHDVKAGEMLKLLDDRAHRALLYMDDSVMAAASGKDLAIMVGVLVDKAQLLRGQPTAILSTEERMSLRDLMPEMVREIRRRGLVIDATADEIIVTPENPGVLREFTGVHKIQDVLDLNRQKQKREIGEP